MQTQPSTKGKAMKYKALAVAFVLAVGLAAWLGATNASAAPVPPLGAKAAPETGEMAPAMRDYTFEQKSQFVDDMKKELTAIDNELKSLNAKAEQLGAEELVDTKDKLLKLEAIYKLDIVRGDWLEAEKRLQRAENAAEPTWNDVKHDFGKAYDELKDSFEKTRQWVNDNVEP